MTGRTVWVVETPDPNNPYAYYDTERAANTAAWALNAASRLRGTRDTALVYPIIIEPAPRGHDYWNRNRNQETA